jgi:autotransporter-associated beta strand protein
MGNALPKAGAGTLTLTGASTYTGSTTVNSPIVTVDNNVPHPQRHAY